MDRRTLALAMALTPGIGAKTICRVLARNDLLGRTPAEFLRIGEPVLVEEYRLRPAAAAKWVAQREDRLAEAREAENRLDRFGVNLVTAVDPHYPHALEALDPDPPGVLFLYGNARLLESRTFAVLSSRKSPPAALDLVERLAEEGVLSGETLTAGHDTPEYQRAAVVPLRWGAPRILVLDRGLYAALGEELSDEPFRTARLWRYRFDPTTDLAVSVCSPDLRYHAGGNKARDRVIAGLARRVDVVIAQPGGNMERLARMALKAGRTVRVSDLSLNYREFREEGAEVIPASPSAAQSRNRV